MSATGEALIDAVSAEMVARGLDPKNPRAFEHVQYAFMEGVLADSLVFADGEVRPKPETLRSGSVSVVGKTESGLLCVVESSMPDDPYVLTPCCQASGTGVEWGIACRACYREAPWECADMGPHLVAVKIAEVTP